jgi:hypothetical protein
MKIQWWTRQLLFVLLLCLSGCSRSSNEPDPLKGWTPARDQDQSHLAKLIQDDFHDYIRDLPLEERNRVADIWIMQNQGHDLAILIKIPLRGTWWHHAIFYDKNSKRIKAIKYKASDYRS